MKKNNCLPFLSLIIIFFLIFTYSCKNPGQTKEEPYVVMLSVDGFRWDYHDKVETPNLDYIAETGVKAKSLKPAFPTKTFPNHYSMATGLYPDHHGIVLNSFYDDDMDKYYEIRNREAVENPDFYDGEPIWVTAENQNVISASYFWVGSEAAVNGVSPTYWKKYDHSFPFEQRIDSVIAWLQLPEKERPHLILWYIHEPDNIGHHFGPDSKEIEDCVVYLDSLIGVFITKIEELPNNENINIIITSDHGMCAISKERTVYLQDYVDNEWIDIIQGYNPNYNIKAKQEFYDTLYTVLKSIPHIKAWKSNEVPKRLHYGTHPRVMDFVVLADSSWSVRLEGERSKDGGTHGYDNGNSDMHAIFYAFGPDFKKGYIQSTFNNVDLYPLIANILSLEPAKTDGKYENVKMMLVE
jgi:predicted AlkP superfamily pyrophosphatase or phosphodiesterase